MAKKFVAACGYSSEIDEGCNAGETHVWNWAFDEADMCNDRTAYGITIPAGYLLSYCYKCHLGCLIKYVPYIRGDGDGGHAAL